MGAKLSPSGKRATAVPTDAALGSSLKDVPACRPPGKNVLVIDVSGTSVKVLASRQTEIRCFRSGETLTPKRMVSAVKKLAGGLDVSIGCLGRTPDCGTSRA
jgi:polyphosphate glucokinase